MTKDLFIKYLQGNCTEKEFEQILFWIREGSQSISGKGIIQEIWEEFEPEDGPVERTKYNRILDKIHHQININQNTSQLITHVTHYFSHYAALGVDNLSSSLCAAFKAA